jgi:hypothetical protein
MRSTLSDFHRAAADAAESAAGRFLRTFQLLLKSTRLYERNHPQLQEALAGAERELREGQAAVPSRALGLRFESGGRVATPSGRAMSDPRSELKPLVEELLRRGIKTMVFLPETHLGELGNLAALLAGKPAYLGPKSSAGVAPQTPLPAEGFAGNWKRLLDNYRIAGIRINAPLEEKKAHPAAPGIAALVLSEAAGADGGEPQAPAQTLEELLEALRLLAEISRVLGGNEGASAPQTILDLRSRVCRGDPRAAAVLMRGIARLASPSSETFESYLERLMEAVVLEFLEDQFNSKRLEPRDVPPLAARIARNVAELSLERPPTGPSAPVALPPARRHEEAWAEHLQERFWLELNPRKRSGVLHSGDAWCVPAGALRRYLEFGVQSEQAPKEEARAVLLDYARCLKAEELQARMATATGLADLRRVIEKLWTDTLPAELLDSIVEALVEEESPEVAGILSAVTAGLADLAGDRGQYGALDRILQALERAPRDEQHEHLLVLARRLLREPRWEALLNESLVPRRLDANLARILSRDPERMLDCLGARLAEGQLTLLSVMARLVSAVGEPAIGALVARLFDPRQQRASTAVKLLATTCPDRLLEALSLALPSWDWQLQDLAVSEMISACSRGALPLRSCARVYLAAVPQSHPLVAR